MTPSDLFPLGNLNDDYDSPWKEALERYLPDFLACACPRNWSRSSGQKFRLMRVFRK
jgi:hypothetical protein